MKNLLDEFQLNELKELYLCSNTPKFLFDSFRRTDTIKSLSVIDSSFLRKEFKVIGDAGIGSIDELVYEYAIAVAFTLKPIEQAVQFFENEGNITFEWFDDIREMYYAEQKPTTDVSIDLKDIKSKPKTHSIRISGLGVNFQEIEI